jgi:signal transduction protein with GAF and PtsI domain
MQPLSKTLRRRLKRLAPELGEKDIERFEHERREAMQAALCEDPLYAAALEPEPEQPTLGLVTARTAPSSEAAESVRVVGQLGPLVLRAAEVERRSLDRKADRALARQGEAARPKRSLVQRAAKKKVAASKPAARKAAARKTAPKRSAPKKGTPKQPGRGKKAAGKPVPRTPRRGR